MVGAKVIAAAGSDDRVKLAPISAPISASTTTRTTSATRCCSLTGGKGVDVLYDNIANPKVLPQAFKALGLDGRLVTAGAHGGPNVTIDFAHLYHKQITIMGRPAITPRHRDKCFAAAAEGKIKAQIERLLPLLAPRRRTA